MVNLKRPRLVKDPSRTDYALSVKASNEIRRHFDRRRKSAVILGRSNNVGYFRKYLRYFIGIFQHVVLVVSHDARRS